MARKEPLYPHVPKSRVQTETGRKLEGRKIRLPDFPGEVFTLTYAGWDDQWIVKNDKGVDMLRCSGDEAIPYLLESGQKCERAEALRRFPPARKGVQGSPEKQIIEKVTHEGIGYGVK